MEQRFSRRRRPSEHHGENTDITRQSKTRRIERHIDTEEMTGPSARIQTDHLTELAESTKPSGRPHKVRLPIEDTASNEGGGATGM